MNSPFQKVIVTMDANGYRCVVWRLKQGISLPQNYALAVEYSRSGGDSWIVLQNDLADVCCYIDSDVRNYNRYINDYYRVRLTISPTEQYVSDPKAAGQYLVYPDSAPAKNIIRLARKQIEISGRKGVLLKRKEWGTHCTHCTDFQGQVSVNEHCEYCMGTGIQGGFYKGIPLTILQAGSNTNYNIDQMGYDHTVTMSCRCIAWPWISLGDAWVDATTNQRYHIDQATVVAAYKSMPLVYQVQMQLAEQTDAIHSAAANAKVAGTDGTSFTDANPDWVDRFQNV